MILFLAVLATAGWALWWSEREHRIQAREDRNHWRGRYLSLQNTVNRDLSEVSGALTTLVTLVADPVSPEGGQELPPAPPEEVAVQEYAESIVEEFRDDLGEELGLEGEPLNQALRQIEAGIIDQGMS